MKKIFLFALGTLLFASCKTTQHTPNTVENSSQKGKPSTAPEEKLYYVEQVKNDFRSVTEEQKNKFLTDYKATEPQYSILFFTQGFNGEEVRVENSNGIHFKGGVTTNQQTGLAKNMRILNTENHSIFDVATRKTIFINAELASQHKFIYVMKDANNKETPYKITYSDLLRPEK
ncbi:hypothetical protein AB4865_01185 [Capnocytophaga sp. ARDL2]|uniref:hypothetical protein n=1 Tax=Capnocytophaga sp. ARDL2 TaxID=3238809 RepID=UPI003556956A